MIWTILQVAIGGALGSVGRYLTGVGADRVLGIGFPYGTMVVNIGGSFVLGLLFVLLGGLSGDTSRYTALLLTGFLGGYTTFSAYSMDCWLLFQQGRITEALLYAFGSAGLSIVACVAGIAIARLSHG